MEKLISKLKNKVQSNYTLAKKYKDAADQTNDDASKKLYMEAYKAIKYTTQDFERTIISYEKYNI